MANVNIEGAAGRRSYHHGDLPAALISSAIALITRPVLFRVMFDPSLDEDRPTLTDAKEAAFGVLLGAVATAQQAGVLRRSDLVDVAITAWATVHGLAQLVIDRALEPRLEGVRALDEWADTVTRLVLTGIGATIEQPPE